MGNTCGCGRAILEIEIAIRGLKEIDKASKEEPEITDRVKHQLEGAQAIYKQLFGIWSSALSTECGMSKEDDTKIYNLVKDKKFDEAEDSLRETLIKCAGMKY